MLAAEVVGCTQSSVSAGGDCARLTDGHTTTIWNHYSCAITHQYGPTWFSFDLGSPKTVTMVSLITGYGVNLSPIHGKEVTIFVGPSQEPDVSEPLCLPMIQQIPKDVFVDYECTESPPPGRYVKLARMNANGGTPDRWDANDLFSLCEVRIFTE